MLKAHQDAYGQEIFAYFQGKESVEIVERDDGFIDVSSGPAIYFAPFEDWHPHQQQAMQFAQGRVLDVGCGAGRVCLYLQEKGHEVVGIDNSPLALEVCRQRGVKQVSPTPINQISKKLGTFDTIVMLGNNFGLFGSYEGAKRLLKKFHRITSPQARIIAESNDIYQTTNPTHLEYHERNRQRGRMAGQIRLRVRYEKCASPWFDYLMVSQEEMLDILEGTGWQVKQFIKAQDLPIYVAIIEKIG